jgi:hypothetical protein
MSRWNDGYGTNKTADYAVQPFSPHVETALHWTEPIDAAPTYHQLTWSPDYIAFESGYEDEDHEEEEEEEEEEGGTIIKSWKFTNATRIPSAEGMLVHINFWLFQGKSDLAPGDTLEVTLRSFSFSPLPK